MCTRAVRSGRRRRTSKRGGERDKEKKTVVAVPCGCTRCEKRGKSVWQQRSLCSGRLSAVRTPHRMRAYVRIKCALLISHFTFFRRINSGVVISADIVHGPWLNHQCRQYSRGLKYLWLMTRTFTFTTGRLFAGCVIATADVLTAKPSFISCMLPLAQVL